MKKTFALILIALLWMTKAQASETSILTETPLIDQAGNPFSFQLRPNTYSIISFIYTTCQSPSMCPLTTALNKKLYLKWKEKKHSKLIHFYFITLDPENDSPDAMKAYALKHQLALNHFTLLTGSLENVSAISSHFSAVGYSGQKGSIAHVPTTVVLNPDLKDFKIFQGNNWNPKDLLTQIEKAQK